MQKIGHYFGMIVTAPGRELYRGCGRLKKRQDIVRTVLLVMILALLTVLLWLLRDDLRVMLLCGIFMAIGCFYLYFLLLKHTDTVIGFAENCFRPFENAFTRHAHAVYGKKKSTGQATKDSARKGSAQREAAKDTKKQNEATRNAT